MTTWVAATAALGILTLGCSGDDDTTDDVKVVEIGEDQVGRCLLVESDDALVTSLPMIDCSEEHSHEIFAVLTMTDEEFPVYPGTEALEAVAERECLTEFEDYVGISPFDSQYFYSWLVPTLESWTNTRFLDRVILCVAGNHDAAPLPPGSIKDSRR